MSEAAVAAGTAAGTAEVAVAAGTATSSSAPTTTTSSTLDKSKQYTPKYNAPLYYFIPPNTSMYIQTVGLVIAVALFFIMFFAIFICYVYVNEDQPDITRRYNYITNAWLFGKDPNKVFQNYVNTVVERQGFTDMSGLNIWINPILDRMTEWLQKTLLYFHQPSTHTYKTKKSVHFGPGE